MFKALIVKRIAKFEIGTINLRTHLLQRAESKFNWVFVL